MAFLLWGALLGWGGAAWAAEPLVVSLSVEGNSQVVAAHILSAVDTKVGEPLDRERLKNDVEAIYELGFFSVVDSRLSEQSDGVAVTFLVHENPVIEDIRFEGNTVYSAEALRSVLFTAPGNVFNRVFFQHDLDRIKEKYQKDGYVMMRVLDVQVDGGVITVKLVEPRVGDIIIQGNTKTKTHVIRRELRVKKGDLFNATLLRFSINRLQGLNYFEDVSVGFEPGESDGEVNLILTVQEQKTGRMTFSIGHGSASGWSGGLGYDDSNWKGLGHKVSVGFETGKKEQYWINYTEPYMDDTHYAWKAGFYKRTWEDLMRYASSDQGDDVESVKYDQKKTGVYYGFGKKFRGNSKMSWFVTLDWHDTEVIPKSGDFDPYYSRNNLLSGKIFTVQASLTRNNLDEYTPYPKGDLEVLTVDQALETLGGEYSFTKYSLEARWYLPIRGLARYVDLFDKVDEEENPIIFATRMRAGFSSGALPWAEQYFVGGGTTVRGFKDDRYEGDEMFLANVELRVPFEKNFSFVVFYDTGMAWDKDLGESFSFSELKGAYGIGVRVKTPLGNIRVDVANGDNETETQFGFGELF